MKQFLVLDKVLKINPNNFVAHVTKADCLVQLKRYTEALTSYNTSLELKQTYTS